MSRGAGETQHKKRVLVIDDEYLIQAIIEDILTNQGYAVLKAGNAAAGIREAVFGNPHLIFLDIVLPDRDGLSVLEELKTNERTQNIPVVLLTALAKSQSIDLNRVAGFISKPMGEKEILTVVENIIGPA